MNKRELIALSFSFLFHFLVVFVILTSHLVKSNGKTSSKQTDSNEKGKSADQGMDVKIKPHEDIVEVAMVEIPVLVKKDAITKSKPKKIVKEECKGQKWFGGIGVDVGYSLGIGKELIQFVYPGYPADRAGILPGDIIMSMDAPSIIGKVGTPINILINRGNQMINIALIRGKICY